jgi:hypothetical protein
MTSQIDWDQSGTARQTQLVNLGPSVGWVEAPLTVELPITGAGVAIVQRGTTLITVNVNGSVTIQLPSSKGRGPLATPGDYAMPPTVIADVGGFAAVHPITILPFGTEQIDGAASLTIITAYGSYALLPIVTTGGWTINP